MSPELEAALCVLCRKRPVEPRWRPFCSERCRLQDLANWADGTYRVAAAPASPDDVADEDNANPSED